MAKYETGSAVTSSAATDSRDTESRGAKEDPAILSLTTRYARQPDKAGRTRHRGGRLGLRSRFDWVAWSKRRKEMINSELEIEEQTSNDGTYIIPEQPEAARVAGTRQKDGNRKDGA